MVEGNYPILIGVGQAVSHWNGQDADTAPDPISMIDQSIELAIDDTGIQGLKSLIDCAAFVRTFPDSLRRPFNPFGKVNNLPAAVLAQAEIQPKRIIYSSSGGEQPQYLVSEMAELLHRGDISFALIAGGEVTGAMKAALKSGVTLDWSNSTDAKIEDRGAKTDYISDYEIANGLGMPLQNYAALEMALIARLELDRKSYLQKVGNIYSRMSEIAASNVYAQFPCKLDAEFISTPSKDNYPVCTPYLKWLVAQDSVNQSASLIMTTVAKARELGVPESNWVYLHGHAETQDLLISKREELSKSRAIELVLDKAIGTSGLTPQDINYWDIYSCFPIVPVLAAEHLGLDLEKTDLTVTGGLPFFGGAGNNYSTNAIATMVEKLRLSPDSFGLVLANGGFMSKEAAAVYSVSPPSSWAPVNCDDLYQKINEQRVISLLNENCEAIVEAYTVIQGKHGPTSGYVIANRGAERIIASIPSDHRVTLKALTDSESIIGRSVSITHVDGKNTAIFPGLLRATTSQGGIMRQFEYIEVEVRGSVLEITINRPDAYNALFSAVHFELAEIFDEFDRRDDLWVAIITGAGDKAFCTGNDLKVTAKGGDMSMPASGFAGLCRRNNRDKPVIAAVNGFAMGGGLEIVLACDLAVADPSAKFALPEVKVGLFAAAGGLQRITRQVGLKQAMDLILTGRNVEAAEAKTLGLVGGIAEPGKVMEAARSLAQDICSNSPSSVRASLRVLNSVDQLAHWDEALGLSKEEIMKLMKTKDFREGVTAFSEKRKPNWING